MKRIGRLLLLSGCVTAIGGATALALTQRALRDEEGNSIPICHSFTADTVGALIRVTQREVPPGVMEAARTAPEFADSDPPLWEGIGSTSYKVTTASPEAQRYFDQGLRLAYAFNHDEARRTFRKAQRLDPDCAMCFWGEALVLGPNINLPMQPAAVPLAVAAGAGVAGDVSLIGFCAGTSSGNALIDCD